MSNEVIFTSATFDVSVDNYEEFDQVIDSEKLGKKLVQTNVLKGTNREYQRYGSKYLLLNIKEKKNSAANKFLVNLAWLTSNTEHNKVIAWKWLSYALAAATVASLCFYIGISETIKLEYSIVSGTITLTAAIIFALLFIYQSHDEYIFKSRYGNARLFLVENKKPSQQEFDDFLVDILLAIDKAQKQISVSDRLVGELKMCRQLRDEGIIDDTTYTIARTEIFKHEQYKN